MKWRFFPAESIPYKNVSHLMNRLPGAFISPRETGAANAQRSVANTAIF